MAKKNTAPKNETKPFVLNFDKIKPKTLSGKPIDMIGKFNESFGDALDRGLPGIRGRRLAEKIFDGGKVELSAEERTVLIAFLNGEQCTLASFAIRALLSELEK
jgi:hypothetical protein